MSNEKRYTARNRVNGWKSKRTFSAAQVAKMQQNPAYKAWVFTEVKPAPVPSTMTKVTKKGTDAGFNDTSNTGTVVNPDGAGPGGDSDSNSNG